jgi:hypothetical protein
MLAAVLATLGLGGSLAVTTAGAAGPVYPIPCVQGGLSTAVTANNAAAAVSASVLATGSFSFTFTGACTGGYRFIAKLTDGRPGKHNRVRVVATVLVLIQSGVVTTVNAQLRPVGSAILNYAASVNAQTPLLLISHVRPARTAVSAEAIQAVLI